MRRLAWVGGLLAFVLCADEAFARVGGGHSYGGGSSSSSSSWSGSGSSGGEAAIVRMLFYLCLEYPAIGVPVTVVVIGGWIYTQKQGGSRRLVPAAPAPPPRAARRRHDHLAALKRRDHGFSETLFLDLVHLLYVRAHEARGRGLDHLAALVDGRVADALRALPGAAEDVLVGSMHLGSVRVTGSTARIEVDFEANWTRIDDGTPTRVFSRERWTFERRADTLSPGPDKMQALRCASCGAALETRPDGTCVACDTVLDDGRLQWRAVQLRVLEQRPVRRPELTLGGGDERGVDLPTLRDPSLEAKARALQARHPDLSFSEFSAYVGEVTVRLNACWSSLAWGNARPFLTDRLYQSMRFWIDGYKASGLRNRVEEVRVERVVLARITLDAWYEAITVRVYASMLDWTEDGDGKVVGGSKRKRRRYSEYWTFVRAAGGGASGGTDTENCPSCAAPLDNVSETGVCGYCDTKLSGGAFHWVLSTIAQDEAYRG